MRTKMTMIYWKGEKFWLEKLLEHPEIMTQEETLEELEENIKDAISRRIACFCSLITIVSENTLNSHKNINYFF